MREMRGDGPGAVIERLSQATNDHDLDALAGCFAEDYRNETPTHPARGFHGRVQVRRNWEQIFAAVPDLTSSVRWTTDQETVWSEWEMRGTRMDGSAHLMRGVVIFGVVGREIAWARFYLELVQEGGGGVDEAIRRDVVVGPAARPASSGRPAELRT
jgi:ketosteroid isomerase-like protein